MFNLKIAKQEIQKHKNNDSALNLYNIYSTDKNDKDKVNSLFQSIIEATSNKNFECETDANEKSILPFSEAIKYKKISFNKDNIYHWLSAQFSFSMLVSELYPVDDPDTLAKYDLIDLASDYIKQETNTLNITPTYYCAVKKENIVQIGYLFPTAINSKTSHQENYIEFEKIAAELGKLLKCKFEYIGLFFNPICSDNYLLSGEVYSIEHFFPMVNPGKYNKIHGGIKRVNCRLNQKTKKQMNRQNKKASKKGAGILKETSMKKIQDALIKIIDDETIDVNDKKVFKAVHIKKISDMINEEYPKIYANTLSETTVRKYLKDKDTLLLIEKLQKNKDERLRERIKRIFDDIAKQIDMKKIETIHIKKEFSLDNIEKVSALLVDPLLGYQVELSMKVLKTKETFINDRLKTYFYQDILIHLQKDLIYIIDNSAIKDVIDRTVFKTEDIKNVSKIFDHQTIKYYEQTKIIDKLIDEIITNIDVKDEEKVKDALKLISDEIKTSKIEVPKIDNDIWSDVNIKKVSDKIYHGFEKYYRKLSIDVIKNFEKLKNDARSELVNSQLKKVDTDDEFNII